ncbi:MAG: YkgJ family cysteine cluster protein [Leptospiraceae bacterium]|nr:YkgJ family cysteine cluster protein [Leptospiraceae bacterium]
MAKAQSTKKNASKKRAEKGNRAPLRKGELNFTEDFSTSRGIPQLQTAGEIDLTFPRFPDEKQMDQTEICLKCHGCCMYITVPLEYPRSHDQRDLYTWYLLHRNVEIYIDHDKTWAIIFKTPCDKLLANGMCSIYETRPQLCRDYSPDSCSRVGKDHMHLFQTPAEMHAYLDRNKKKSGSAKKSAKKSTKKSTKKAVKKKAAKKKTKK